MEQIVECIPNFSEARDLQKVKQIAAAIESVDGVEILNLERDLDHNRTVITFIGGLRPVLDAAFFMISKAAQLIDLTEHQGVHPRMGATDVCPFVAVKNVDEKVLIKEVEALAKRVGDELFVPIFLYEKSAHFEARRNLADIRRGGFEALNERLGSEGWIPDFGPTKMPFFGATVMGVRNFLIAYNINLESNDLQLAKDIARKIRESSGGMKSVKALGLWLEKEGCAQVSMNLVNFHDNNICDVYVEVERLASEAGAAVRESELIGLIPEQAMVLSDGSKVSVAEFAKAFKFKNFSADKVLGNR
jgi:glutamate formiminotransferase